MFSNLNCFYLVILLQLIDLLVVYLFNTVFVFQLDIFELIGVPLVENCLAGFNSSVFAYGQVSI